MAKTLTKSDSRPTREEIARRAYALFEQSGRIPGRDMQNWLAAEAELSSARKPGTESQPDLKNMAKPAPLQRANHRA